jgi:Xaa-Pro aminopeptidase
MNEAAKEIKGGVSEKELAARIDFLLMRNGADRPAFETIAASGPNASMPHARPTSKKIRVSEPLILDFGARFNGYNSDLTRTYFVGKISVYFRLIYNIVRTAQAKAIEKVKPGTKISQVDLAARSYITEKGFGKYFGHGTGHSIGLEVHELPSINSKNHHLLKEGMVFTVEPAIYIPGWGGVRTEDVVVVTSKGYKVLTR